LFESAGNKAIRPGQPLFTIDTKKGSFLSQVKYVFYLKLPVKKPKTPTLVCRVVKGGQAESGSDNHCKPTCNIGLNFPRVEDDEVSKWGLGGKSGYCDKIYANLSEESRGKMQGASGKWQVAKSKK
jgi:hypothetical protein